MHPKVIVTTTSAKLLQVKSIPNILEAQSFIVVKANWETLNVFRTHWYEENLNLYGVTLELEGHQPILNVPLLVHNLIHKSLPAHIKFMLLQPYSKICS